MSDTYRADPVTEGRQHYWGVQLHKGEWIARHATASDPDAATNPAALAAVAFWLAAGRRKFAEGNA